MTRLRHLEKNVSNIIRITEAIYRANFYATIKNGKNRDVYPNRITKRLRIDSGTFYSQSAFLPQR